MHSLTHSLAGVTRTRTHRDTRRKTRTRGATGTNPKPNRLRAHPDKQAHKNALTRNEITGDVRVGLPSLPASKLASPKNKNFSTAPNPSEGRIESRCPRSKPRVLLFVFFRCCRRIHPSPRREARDPAGVLYPLRPRFVRNLATITNLFKYSG